MSTTPAAWLARLVPRRSPPFLAGLAITVGAMAVAIALRGVILGWNNALGLSATQFPAYIVAALYAGQRWGWGALIAGMALSLTTQSIMAQGVSMPAINIMFFLSAAACLVVAGALRENLLRLDEAQAALDTAEARLTMAQEAGGVGVWSWDLINDESHWSSSLYKNVGLPLNTPANIRSVLDVVHPDDRQAVRHNNIRAIKGGRLDPLEFRVIWPDGQTRWLLSRGDMILDAAGHAIRAVGVNIDITERRIADEQVRESEARFRALADSAPVLLWVSRTDGKREFVNQAYVDFLGEAYENAINFDWRERLHAEDLPRILKEQAAGEASRQLFNLEARYRRIDGEWRWIRSISQPRYGPAGEFIGFIGIAVDVTDAKQAEADLQRINDLLADNIQAALSERDNAEAALRQAQKMEAVGQLTGGVAHDFNNLLTVVIGALDLIQRHPKDEARRERMIEAALGAARRGERLTQQLLAFSRRQPLKPELLVVDTVLSEADPLLRRAVGEAVRFTVTPGAAGAVARLDAGQFEAAVMNLVVNARDAVSQGGAIRVESAVVDLAEGEAPEVAAGRYIAVLVHDTGVGMAPDVIARVFEPFFTTKDVGKGTGLGLSQVYGFARQTGGGVAIESAPGKGTTVRLYLPLSAAAAQPAASDAADPGRAAAPALRILLVEDDEAVGDMVAAMLEDLGHQVLRADGVPAAQGLLQGDAALDLMLTDLVMPGELSGVDLAHQAVKLRPGLPVILSSGYTGEALGPAEAAPWPLLRKPYSAEALARMIEQVRSPSPQAA